jgi:pyridinium-3,5-biscarboxylic acid mononucleotide sulfurtransferase
MTVAADLPLTATDREAADRVMVLLAGTTPLGVVFSDVVDSSTLLAPAARALGRDQVLAMLGVSPSLAETSGPPPTGSRPARHPAARP